jgi:hypothetical protein
MAKIKNTEELYKVYGQLGQILDGTWFLEIEKRYGFDIAYEIDWTVWSIYPRKEAQRLKKYLGIDNQPDKITVEDIKNVLGLSLFNTSLTFEIEPHADENSKMVKEFLIKVSKCKTLEGMEKVKRPKNQIAKICEGIGDIFFKTLIGELIPNTTITCVCCPFHKENDSIACDKFKPYVCIWEVKFPHPILNHN